MTLLSMSRGSVNHFACIKDLNQGCLKWSWICGHAYLCHSCTEMGRNSAVIFPHVWWMGRICLLTAQPENMKILIKTKQKKWQKQLFCDNQKELNIDIWALDYIKQSLLISLGLIVVFQLLFLSPHLLH